MFCGGCYYDFEAACREYRTSADAGFSVRDLPPPDNIRFPLPSPEGSVHSNDSLSDSSPSAPGVPTQVVQQVQAAQQVGRNTQTNMLLLEEVANRGGRTQKL